VDVAHTHEAQRTEHQNADTRAEVAAVHRDQELKADHESLREPAWFVAIRQRAFLRSPLLHPL
jgi:hypothetical protein